MPEQKLGLIPDLAQGIPPGQERELLPEPGPGLLWEPEQAQGLPWERALGPGLP